MIGWRENHLASGGFIEPRLVVVPVQTEKPGDFPALLANGTGVGPSEPATRMGAFRMGECSPRGFLTLTEWMTMPGHWLR